MALSFPSPKPLQDPSTNTSLTAETSWTPDLCSPWVRGAPPCPPRPHRSLGSSVRKEQVGGDTGFGFLSGHEMGLPGSHPSCSCSLVESPALCSLLPSHITAARLELETGHLSASVSPLPLVTPVVSLIASCFCLLLVGVRRSLFSLNLVPPGSAAHPIFLPFTNENSHLSSAPVICLYFSRALLGCSRPPVCCAQALCCVRFREVLSV